MPDVFLTGRRVIVIRNCYGSQSVCFLKDNNRKGEPSFSRAARDRKFRLNFGIAWAVVPVTSVFLIRVRFVLNFAILLLRISHFFLLKVSRQVLVGFI